MKPPTTAIRDAAARPLGAWQLPARPLGILLVSVLIGLIGFAWAQRGAFYHVAQTAILAEKDEGAAGSRENRIDASLGWHFLPAGPQGPELRADFDIPGTGAKIRLSMHKNTDATLPASHLIEIVTSTPPDFPDKAVAEIGKLTVKLAPEAIGAELIGDVAQISEGVFWIGLSVDPTDTDVNLRLLALGNFFDLPLTYKSGERATLTFEKGRTGVAAFEQAITAFRR